MSIKNVVSTQKVGSRALVTFRVDDDSEGNPQFRTYRYSARAGAQIRKGRDPREFKATEIKEGK
jgi:hypothetical protein